MRIELAPAVVAEEGGVGQVRIAKRAVRQKPESTALAEPGFGTILCLAIGTTMIHFL